MPGLTDVVKHLIIINVVIFFLASTAAGAFLPDMALYFPADSRFSPYQLVTHMFMHADTGHLFFNMFGLYVFGPYVERYIGEKKFFLLYFASGVGALVAHFAVTYFQMSTIEPNHFRGMVGASGALMGVIMAFAVLFPNLKLQLIIPPVPIKAKYLAAIYIVIDLFSGVTGAQANVANFAHLGGALTGILLTYFLFKKKSFRR